MKLIIEKPELFKSIINAVSEIVTECVFKADKDMLRMIAFDPANVCMVELKLLQPMFSTFEVGEEERIGINLDNLKQILRRFRAEDLLTIFTEPNINHLNIVLEGKNKRHFTIPLLDIEDKNTDSPNLDYKMQIDLAGNTFVEAIEDVNVVSQCVKFITTPDKFEIIAEGDTSKATIDITPSDTTIIDAIESSRYVAKYSVEYLKKYLSSTKISDKVVIRYDTDYPLRISFTEPDKFSLVYTLAPRVDSN
jgi:proliferating cell nuclear antigen